MRNLFQGVVLALFLAGSAMAQVMGPSGNIPYTANGGSVARTPSAQSADVTNTVNYGATAGGTNTTPMTNALAQSLSSGGGAVWVPGGYAGTWSYAYPDPSVFQEFDGPNINRSQLGFGAAATDSNKVFSGVLGTTRPSSNNRAGVSDWWWSQGSGANGANHADFAHSFYEQKQNYNCSTARQAAAQCATVALQGENDVLYIAGYQGGPDATSSASLKSAGGLATGSETCVGGIGFCLQLEFHTDILDPSTLAVALDMDTQYGAVNTRTGEQTGYGIYENLNSTRPCFAPDVFLTVEAVTRTENFFEPVDTRFVLSTVDAEDTDALVPRESLAEDEVSLAAASRAAVTDNVSVAHQRENLWPLQRFPYRHVDVGEEKVEFAQLFIVQDVAVRHDVREAFRRGHQHCCRLSVARCAARCA